MLWSSESCTLDCGLASRNTSYANHSPFLEPWILQGVPDKRNESELSNGSSDNMRIVAELQHVCSTRQTIATIKLKGFALTTY